jgi:hypothetical protein
LILEEFGPLFSEIFFAFERAANSQLAVIPDVATANALEASELLILEPKYHIKHR